MQAEREKAEKAEQDAKIAQQREKELAEKKAKEEAEAKERLKREEERRKREEELACRICYEQPGEMECFKLSVCQHEMHKKCLAEYFTSQIKSYKKSDMNCLKCQEEQRQNCLVSNGDVLQLVPEMNQLLFNNAKDAVVEKSTYIK